MTDVGQKLIAENGYVPIKKVTDAKSNNNKRNCKDNFVDEEGYPNYVYELFISKNFKTIYSNKNVSKYQFEFNIPIKDLFSAFKISNGME